MFSCDVSIGMRTRLFSKRASTPLRHLPLPQSCAVQKAEVLCEAVGRGNHGLWKYFQSGIGLSQKRRKGQNWLTLRHDLRPTG